MITKDELKQIIINSKIAFSDAEIETFQVKLNEALDMVSIISELDLTDVEPMFYPNEHAYNFRNPQLALVTDKTALLANAPESEDGYLKVPTVLKDGEA